MTVDAATGRTVQILGDHLHQFDRAELEADCMRGLGFEVDTLDTGFIKILAPPEQQAAGNAAQDQCSMQIAERYPYRDLTQRDFYNELLEVAECLNGFGFEVLPPPSFETWEESFNESGGNVWHPYDGVLGQLDRAGAGDSDWVGINRACPQPTR